VPLTSRNQCQIDRATASALTPHAPAQPSAARGTAGPPTLPSEQLRRLADRAAAALVLPVPAVDHERELPAAALARVLDAVEASTAAATKKAYRSDWQRFAAWAGAGGFPPLPAPPAVIAHYVTEAAAQQTGGGKWRYAPATLTRWVASINQVHTAAGLDGRHSPTPSSRGTRWTPITPRTGSDSWPSRATPTGSSMRTICWDRRCRTRPSSWSGRCQPSNS